MAPLTGTFRKSGGLILRNERRRDRVADRNSVASASVISQRDCLNRSLADKSRRQRGTSTTRRAVSLVDWRRRLLRDPMAADARAPSCMQVSPQCAANTDDFNLDDSTEFYRMQIKNVY